MIKHYNIQNNLPSVKYFCNKWEICSKIEVRISKSSAYKKSRLSIYRFIWSKIVKLSNDEKIFILNKLWLNENEIDITYQHILN